MSKKEKSTKYFEKACRLSEQDKTKKAVKWYSKAALLGHAEAQNRLGNMYKYGLNVDKDFEKAVFWYKKAAEQGCGDAQFSIALMYYGGDVTEQDNEIAVYWLEKAVDNGIMPAKLLLSSMYEQGLYVEQNIDLADELMSSACSENIGEVQLQRALRCYMDESYEQAVYWGTKAAEQGNVSAQVFLSNLYFDECVGRDCGKAIYWRTKAAEQGDFDSQLFLGKMYYEGDNIERDYEKAMKWLLQVLEKETQYIKEISSCLYDGQRANSVYAEAIKQGYSSEYAHEMLKQEKKDYLLKLLDFGHVYFMLGSCYHNGYGVKSDWQKAKEYYQKAVEFGYNCNYALEMVKIDLGEYNGQAEMRKYADSLIDQGLGGRERRMQIENDLKEDFGKHWDKLQDKAKKSLITGVYTYVDYYELGEEYYVDMDFSTAITALCKALEITLTKYFYTGYVRYLKSKNISPSVFPADSCFIKVSKDGNGKDIKAYKDEDDTDAFTLGSFYYIIDSKFETKEEIEQRCNGMRSVAYRRRTQYVKEDGVFVKKSGERTISRYMADYADTLFSEDAFGNVNRERAIVNYLIDLASDVYTIKKHQRNPASHKNLMSCRHAEACGDYLLKVRKVIAKILEKID